MGNLTRQETRITLTSVPAKACGARTMPLTISKWRPLESFKSLDELLLVLRDAIEGHRHLYMHGILYGDIHPGNIIIVERQVPTTSNDSAATGDLTTYPPYGGCLIDLDRAACGEKSGKEIGKEILGTDLPPEADNSASESDQLQDINFMKRTLHKTFPSMTIQIDVAEAALLAYSNIHMASLYLLKAIQHYITFHHETVISAGNLLWELTPPKYNYEDLRISVTLTSDSEVHSRTGTPPYISYEILAGMAYFQERNIMHHDAIHDIESFFWVLVYLCLTRGGPGGTRRKEFDEAAMQTDLHAFIERQPEATRFLIRVVSETFDSLDQNDLKDAKLGFFKNPAMFDNVVVANFHPYFEPLKGLIREWFSLLLLAYKFHDGYEYHAMHDFTLRIFDKKSESKLDIW